MTGQTRKLLVRGRRILCGPCHGAGQYRNVSCERPGCVGGRVLSTLHTVEGLRRAS